MGERSKEAVAEWRRRREERRAKQREANVGRAAKMHAARVAWEKDNKVGKGVREPPAVNVGCSGWYYWHWRDHIYRGVERAKWFETYAGEFSTVELNAPFYSWPTVPTVKTWVRQVPEGRGFVYAVKVSELITHVKRFVGTKTLVRDFGFVADLLGERFGCFLFQLPPSYSYTAGRLKAILSQLDGRRRNVVEFRHRSWWREDVYRGFRDAGVTFCSCSGPRLPDELVVTSDDVYVRFHGTKRWYRHDYSAEELDVWAERIREARKSGVTRVWAYFNNDREGFAIGNAKTLRGMLERKR